MMSTTRGKEGLGRLPVWAAAFVALICISMLGLSVWREWDSRAAGLKNAEASMANLAYSLTQHAEDSLELLDASIIGIVSRLEMDGTSPKVMSQLQKVLDVRTAALGRIHDLVIYDENGRWPPTMEQPNRTGPDVSDRAFFQHHNTATSRDAFVGRPVSISGTWTVTLSRRFDHPDGRFAGVVLASIATEYFAQFYQQFDVGSHGAISLLSADGVMLARGHDPLTYVGTDLSKAPLFREPLSQMPAGVYYFKSPLDGLQRLGFFNRSSRFPLIVLASIDQEQVLAPYRDAAFTHTLFAGLLTSLIAVIGGFLVRVLYLRQRLVSALVAKEADFRLLAEESSDMVTRIGLDERMQYVSPSSATILGWGPRQLTGTPALAGVNAEDLPAIAETVAALKRGIITDARLIYRTRHRDAKEIWLESTMRVTHDQVTGEIDGVVAISRDVTVHKVAHDELEALATLDGLTGLANRRHFNDRLQDEWARACREGTPLSLLMIDVDHFKKFNDRYGHPAGDACLQAIAEVLNAEARRPADLAARYGGEEFVLLMPNTDAAGCAQLGERIKLELHKLGIPHALNPPGGSVTASLGGATMSPVGERWTDCRELLTAADGALYVAKDRGRDRLVMWKDTIPKRDIGIARRGVA